jgi:hypothetical protein
VGIFVSKDHNVTLSSNWITICVCLGDEKTHGWDSRIMGFSEFMVFDESEFLESVKFAKPIIFIFV